MRAEVREHGHVEAGPHLGLLGVVAPAVELDRVGAGLGVAREQLRAHAERVAGSHELADPAVDALVAADDVHVERLAGREAARLDAQHPPRAPRLGLYADRDTA